jgi:hypothetical protein
MGWPFLAKPVTVGVARFIRQFTHIVPPIGSHREHAVRDNAKRALISGRSKQFGRRIQEGVGRAAIGITNEIYCFFAFVTP